MQGTAGITGKPSEHPFSIVPGILVSYTPQDGEGELEAGALDQDHTLKQ